RYIPKLKRNLISLGTLEKEGYTVKLQSGKIKVINGSRIVLSGTRRDNCVYSLDGHAVAGEINASIEEKDSLAKEAVKWILKYLRGTADVGLIYGTNHGNHKDATGFVDSDYAKDPNKELGVELNRVTVNCDNQGAIHLSRNHVFHERTKHINVRYHFIREVLEAKTVEVLKVGTEHNDVDALTKVVPRHKLQHCLELLSVGIC
nr:retrovirus-related Pol polyprotein from transposon TNT 1-94 [Tanacetum cinerariifolium]